MLLYYDGQGVREQSTVTLAGRVDLAEEGTSPATLDVQWRLDEEVICEDQPDEEGLTSCELTFGKPGTVELALQAQGPRGDITQTVDVQVRDNQAPTEPVVSVSPDAPQAHEDLSVQLDDPAIDPDGDEVSYTYTWFRDGEPTEHDDPVLAASKTTVEEAWHIEVTPHDDLTAGTAGSSEPVSILPTLPTFDQVAIVPNEPQTGDVLSLELTDFSAPDTDDTPGSHTFAWKVQPPGQSPYLASETDTLGSDAFEKGDLIWVEVTPIDANDTDGEPQVSQTVLVQATPPTADGAAISPSEPGSNDELTAELVGFEAPDTDDEPGPHTYDWELQPDGGSWNPVGYDLPFLPAAYVAQGDQVQVTVTPRDADGVSGDPVSSDPITVLPTPPSLDGVDISPSQPNVTDTLTVALSGFTAPDTNDEPGTHEHAWHVRDPGDPWPETPTATTPTLETGFAQGQEVQVTVAPNDADGQPGTPVVSDAVTVVKAPPVMVSVEIVDDLGQDPWPITDSELYCDAQANDPDEELTSFSFTYAWAVDGNALPDEDGSTLDGAHFVRGQVVTCTATPSDGDETGAPKTSEGLEIENAPPVLAGVDIEPEEPHVGDVLEAKLAGLADPDGEEDLADPIYEWLVSWDGDGDWENVAVSSSEFDSDWLEAGDQVRVRVTPVDQQGATGIPRISDEVELDADPEWAPKDAAAWFATDVEGALFQDDLGDVPATADEDPVGRIVNLLGDPARDWTQSAGADPLSLVIEDDLPFVRASDTEGEMDMADLDIGRNVPALTLMAVTEAKFGGAAHDANLINIRRPTEGARFVMQRVDGAWRVGGRRLDEDDFEAVDGVDVTLDQRIAIVGQLDYENARARFWKNGVKIDDVEFQTPGFSALTSSESVRFSAPSLGGDLAEMILYQRAPSANEIDAFFEHARDHWDVPMPWRVAYYDPESAPTTRGLEVIGDRIWALMSNRKVVFSEDFGRSWVEQDIPSGLTSHMTKLEAYDALTLYAVEHAGNVVRTVDGGHEWELLTSPIDDQLRGLHVVSEDEVWVVGRDGPSRGSAFFTDDGGATWEHRYEFESTGTLMQDAYFLDADTGWIAGGGTGTGAVRYTEDGGENWDNRNVSGATWIETIKFLDEAVGFAVERDSDVYKTTDGGLSWTSIFDGGTMLRKMAVFNEDHLLVVGTDGEVWRTQDGGDTWTDASIVGLDEPYRGIGFDLDDPQRVAIGGRGKLIVVSDSQGL